MNVFKRRGAIALLAATAVIAITAGTVLANPTGYTGNAQNAFAAKTENGAATFGPGAGPMAGWYTVESTTVASNTGDTIVARFTAESACYGGFGYCAARIVVDGVEADPQAALDFAFDTTDGNTATSKFTESHSVERVTPNINMGTSATVEVQVRMVGGGVRNRLDDWTLTAYSIAP
jgi:hypothetical protein